MLKQLSLALLLAHVVLACAQTGSGASALTERDFLNDMPIVLSVSRLAQPLDEAPGAVTILDRNFIRMSGARDITDLLRLVPGFQASTAFETDAPMASYHGRNDDWVNRIQVLVDGRSVYTSYLQGSAGLGLQTLAIDDIERIEVLRGSNSASFGARAFLGVINIVSRSVKVTGGASAEILSGDNRVSDYGGRIGWGSSEAMYRVSAGSREDAGLRGAFGKNRIDRANVSANVVVNESTELDIRFGGVDIDAGLGVVGDIAGNPARMRNMGSRFLQFDWQHTPDEYRDVSLSASHTENSVADRFLFLYNGSIPATSVATGLASSSNFMGVMVDFSGHEYNDALTLQYTVKHSPFLRTVVGGELRREKVVSPPIFHQREEITTDYSRIFGNVEWRFMPNMVLNFGGLAESSTIAGDSFSPRAMVNWHVHPGHTLRAGISTAFRPPSAYEKYADIRYYDAARANFVQTVKASGQVNSEEVESRELGYHMSISDGALSGDLRVFNERIRGGIERPYAYGYAATDYRNIDYYLIEGAEYQIKWQPMPMTQVVLSQAMIDISGMAPPVEVDDRRPYRIKYGAPKLSGSLVVMHTLNSGLEVSIMYNHADDFALMAGNSGLYSMERTDMRIGKSFRLGRNKTSLAMTLQNLNVPYRDGYRDFYFDQRALISLRVEY